MEALPPLRHLVALSDDVGVIQHALEEVPNRSTGYCTDDVARALIVVLGRLGLDPHDRDAERLAGIYLAYLHDAQLPDGRFHNFMSYDRRWLDPVGSQDSVGRAVWALGYAMRYAPRPAWRRVATRLFDRAIDALDWLGFPRSQAYAAIGLAHACSAQTAEAFPPYRSALRALADALRDRLEAGATAAWHWYEPAMTYDNARLPEAVLRAGTALGDAALVQNGLRAFDFCTTVCMEDGIFVPVGNAGWYPQGGVKARYAQQPLEAVAMVDAALAALDAGGDAVHEQTAACAYAWYEGRNSRGIVMAREGGCLDGLDEYSVNANLGAESTLAYLAAANAMAARRSVALRLVR